MISLLLPASSENSTNSTNSSCSTFPYSHKSTDIRPLSLREPGRLETSNFYPAARSRSPIFLPSHRGNFRSLYLRGVTSSHHLVHFHFTSPEPPRWPRHHRNPTKTLLSRPLSYLSAQGSHAQDQQLDLLLDFTKICFEPAAMEAPLSSPSLNGPSKNQPSYFSSSTSSSAQSSGPTSAPQSTQQQPPLQPPPQRQLPTDSASPFLRDFNLVAEAAKRAQMACLMRDLEAVGI